MSTDRVEIKATGFDVQPARPVPVTMLLFVAVVTASAGFAHLFKASSQYVIALYAGASDPTRAAGALSSGVRFAVVTGATCVAAALDRIVERRWAGQTGVQAVAASARGENDKRISMRATALRTLATWMVSAGLVSIGRESAIIETGGALGALAARALRGRGDAMATAGIAAAFAAAYHAPIAAVFYVEEHLGVRRSRRALLFGTLGGVGGHLASVEWFGGEVIFPTLRGSPLEMLQLALLGLLPAVLAARLLLQLRVRVSGGALARRLRIPEWLAVALLAVLAGAAVAAFPAAAGNGMEALGHASVRATLALGLALGVGKLVGTTAALGAGAPGGVLTPTISVASGVTLLTLLGAQTQGLLLHDPWDAMVAAMAVGVAVGLRSPWVAVFLLPEMLGDYALVPAVALIVLLAVGIDRLLDRIVVRAGRLLPTGIYDEDA